MTSPASRSLSWTRARRIALAMCLPLAAGATGMGAQEVSAREARLTALFSSLAPDTRVRVVTGLGVVETGRIGAVGDAGITVLREGARHEIELREVRTVAVEGGHGRQGSLWGLGAGLLVGGFVGAVVGSLDCRTRSGCRDSETQGALRWAAVAGGLGAAVGFWIGRRQAHWHPRFP